MQINSLVQQVEFCWDVVFAGAVACAAMVLIISIVL